MPLDPYSTSCESGKQCGSFFDDVQLTAAFELRDALPGEVRRTTRPAEIVDDACVPVPAASVPVGVDFYVLAVQPLCPAGE